LLISIFVLILKVNKSIAYVYNLWQKKIKRKHYIKMFVNSIVETVDTGFPEIVGLINDAPEFVTSPNIKKNDKDKFMMIVFAGNLKMIYDNFNNGQEDRLIQYVYDDFCKIFEIDVDQLKSVVKNYQCYIAKYNLSVFQDEYFKRMKSPNPMFLKRLDEAMENFVWNWDI